MDSSWFKTEFQALTGCVPYPWQEQLFQKFVEGEIPQNMGLPTGTGKTSTIVIWLLAFIKNPTLPRRIVYVVDRRSVVDQATAVVEKIVTQLSPEVNDALKAYTLKDEAVLGVSTLRGEFVDNGEWSKLPFRPAVLVGTVDMVGSRLLFSGYGDGAYSRPKHAGLLGNDTLVVFDECHLVPAFETLLRNIEHAGGKLKPFFTITMSATSNSADSISLSDADLENTTLSQRLKAKKTLHLHETGQPLKMIAKLALENPPARTIVFVQSPRDVVNIADVLKKQYRNVVALTGTIRGKERDELVDNPVFQAFTVPAEPLEPHFLVATSAGEVGIDLTCTRMITDASYAASLVQRFGRCNRFAEAKNADIYVVFREAEVRKAGVEEDYTKKSRPKWGEGDLNFITSLGGDASCWNLYQKRGQLAELSKLKSVVPTLEPAVLDVLSMTSLHHSIDISDYLRGKASNTHYVEIAWREETPLLTKLPQFDFDEYMKYMRVLSFEKLNETEKRVLEVVAEIGGDTPVIVVNTEAERRVARLSELQRGDLKECLLILPPTVGGLTGGMFSARNVDGAQLDIATLEHTHHEARDRIVCADGAEPTLEKNQKEVFNKIIDEKVLIVRKIKEVLSRSRVFLAEHNAEVRATAEDFAVRTGLAADLVSALEQAGQLHDVGKENPLWQIAAVGRMSNPALAKPIGRFKNPYALKGFRHEFESLMRSSECGELTKHLIAVHHAGARPTWCGSRDLAPVNRNDDAVVEAANRFASLQDEYGWWGLAYLEAIFKSADSYASDD
jgi:CRISPR-associated endonuclease/helicase Cas3